MNIPIKLQGGGYDGTTHIFTFPDDADLSTIKSLGIPTDSKAIANFPVISASFEEIILDGEKLTWEMRLNEIPVHIQGGEHAGKKFIFKTKDEINIFDLKDRGVTLKIKGLGDLPILDVSPSGILVDGSKL